jgi:integrase
LLSITQRELTILDQRSHRQQTFFLAAEIELICDNKIAGIEDFGVALPWWHPNQLRHAKATEIRREAGLDAARAVLGHRSPQVTEVYAEIDVSKAAEVMARLG